MGYGKKAEMINRKETENTPSPFTYNIHNLFEENVRKGKGTSLSQKLKYKVNFLLNKYF